MLDPADANIRSRYDINSPTDLQTWLTPDDGWHVEPSPNVGEDVLVFRHKTGLAFRASAFMLTTIDVGTARAIQYAAQKAVEEGQTGLKNLVVFKNELPSDNMVSIRAEFQPL